MHYIRYEPASSTCAYQNKPL